VHGLKISKKRVELIVHEYLDKRKLCAKWVPRVLTIDQNQQCVYDLDFGAMFSDIRRNKDEFFRRYITKDVYNIRVFHKKTVFSWNAYPKLILKI
jgi:hypothetical protein